MSDMIGNFETVRIVSMATDGTMVTQGSLPRHAPRAGDLLTSLALPAIFRLHRGA
ncbi:hypothetical protein PMI11_04736 [Rhizobium sp. CF142]|nr:hypothetical protein PMI11_04736 [Rhizobium sp. CF142]